MKKLSIIIPALNEEKYLPHLFDCLQKQSFTNFKVIVADANSTDGTRELSLINGAQVVSGGLPGAGRNAGVKLANKGNWILFLDADVGFNETFLADSLSYAESKGIDITNYYFSYTGKILEDFMHFHWNLATFIAQFTRKPWVTGHAILIKSTVFQQLGGFDESLETSEDFDLIVRAKASGYKFAVLPFYVTHSKRRFQKMGYIRIITAYILSSIFFSFGVAGMERSKDLIRRLNGGWGKW